MVNVDDDEEENVVQCLGGRGKAVGAGASKHLLPANNEMFGGDEADDDVEVALLIVVVDDAVALLMPGLERCC